MVVEGVEHVRHGVEVRHEVTRDNDGVGSQVAQGAHPRLLGALAGHQVQVRQVQDPQLGLARRQQRHRVAPQRVAAGLPPRVGKARARSGEAQQGSGPDAHGPWSHGGARLAP